jgi:CRISPR system Cascade subunit CasB
VGKSPWSIPALWGLVFEGMPDECSNDCAAENAIYAAITLYAMHQQSRDVKKSPMSVPKVSLGAAVHRLASVRDGDQWNKGPVWRRFVRAVTSNDVEEFALHLRGLVQFLRSEGISLDYPALAENLYWFHFSKGRDRVRRSWGLDFYKNKKEDTKNDEE